MRLFLRKILKKFEKIFLANIFRMPYSTFTYRIARRYSDYYDGNNGFQMSTNGELHVVEKLFSKVSTSDRVVFDIGSNTGAWSKAILRISSNVCLYLFEPNTDCYHKIKNSNLLQNVNVNLCAMGETRGYAEIAIYKDSVYSSIYPIYSKKVLFSNTVKVETVDQYCFSEGISDLFLMKVDVEGYEKKVIQGADRMLTDGRIDFVQFEYGPNYISARAFLKDIFDFLCARDYKVYKIYPQHLQYFESYTRHLETMKGSNFLAVRRDIKVDDLYGFMIHEGGF